MLDLILEETKEKMEKSIEAFKHELSSVRTGRANPTMLDRVKVNYWGEMTPLNQTAGISVVEGRQLVVKPYDKNILKDIEHAIYEANLGLTPQNDGEIIRINVPALTEETRREYVKQAKKYAEDAKVALRNIRRNANDDVKVEVLLINNDIWLTQNLIADLFGVARSTITDHINNILKSEELREENTVGKTDVVNSKKPVKIYNLDMIIAVGYRVNSKKATDFRIWATKILKEYMIKGVVMDDERLKNPNYIFGEDYFEEILERIRNIRASERRFYQKITDIYSACSIDYDKDAEITKTFFKTVQNKLHYAVTGNTAAEIIYNRVDSNKEHMGLTSWKQSPNGPIYKYDVDIAKNYLTEKELHDLNRIVTMYLDYAELQAENHNAMTMQDWIERLDVFLQFNGQDILHNAGKISQKVAQELAYKEYDKYKLKQDKLYVSDYDMFVEQIKLIENKK